MSELNLDNLFDEEVFRRMIEYKMGYKFTDDIKTIQSKLDKSYREHAQEQMRDLLAHSKPKKLFDPYVWYDPWEFI